MQKYSSEENGMHKVLQYALNEALIDIPMVYTMMTKTIICRLPFQIKLVLYFLLRNVAVHSLTLSQMTVTPFLATICL